MRAPGIRAVALFAATALTVVGCSGGGTRAPDGSGTTGTAGAAEDAGVAGEPEGAGEELPPLPERFTAQTLDWGPCPPPGVLQGAGEAPGAEWECADLVVPLDYAAPDNGGTLGIAVIRARSTGTTGVRVGSLVFNFGGPGGSGVATLPRAADRYTTLRGGFDLVAFDPRGVGASEGIRCRTDAELDAAGQDDHGPPRTPAEERELLAESREYAAACEARAGALLPHLTTENTARDLDLLRHALGDSQLHYFGISYGSKLGAVHAHLFPERVGRTVLDAVVDPTRDVTGRALLQTEGFQLALDNYLADCAARVPDCPTGPDPGAGAHAVLTGLLDALRDRPLPTGTGRELTAGLARTAWLAMLYSEAAWPALTEALGQALDEGRGDLLLASAERYNGRDQHGRYRNIHAANNAINCADFRSRPDLGTVHAHAAEFAAASPVFGEAMAWSLLSCAHWPVTGERDRPEVSAPGARPILLLGTTGDPATPYEGAERMREALGEGVGVLLTYDGEGHGAHTSGDPCVTAAVNAHLLAGTTPPDDTVCR
jgi:pimeloyl-ACP methyl ester carboxylesterase